MVDGKSQVVGDGFFRPIGDFLLMVAIVELDGGPAYQVYRTDGQHGLKLHATIPFDEGQPGPAIEQLLDRVLMGAFFMGSLANEYVKRHGHPAEEEEGRREHRQNAEATRALTPG